MTKKTLLLIIPFLLNSQLISAMLQPSPDKSHVELFNACERGDLEYVKSCIASTSVSFNINYQNEHGETALVRAAACDKWNIADYLLEQGANKNIRDNYGQSFFSKAFHARDSLEDTNQLKKIVHCYTSKEINEECKLIPIARDAQYQFAMHSCTVKLMEDVLKRNKITFEVLHCDETALQIACLNRCLWFVKQLLQVASQKNMVQVIYKDSFFRFQRTDLDLLRFAVREIFNNDSCLIDKSQVIKLFTFLEDPKGAFKKNLFPELIHIIKQQYLQLLLQDFFQSEEYLQTIEAKLWKPVCIRACKINGFLNQNDDNAEETDEFEKYCLRNILLLPQEEKTKLNLKLWDCQSEEK